MSSRKNPLQGNLRRLLAFVRKNKRPLALRALVLAVPALVLLLFFFHPWRREPSGETAPSVILPEWESISYINPAYSYDSAKFNKNGSFLSYEDDAYVSVQGIDVSSYTGDIDWEKVKKAGIRFAFLRLGYRGYTKGGISLDASYEKNLAGASAQGIPIGVYFFSQALDEDEAREEAAFCIQHLKGVSLSLPVIYDPEDAPTDSARTKDLSGEQITENALAFCQAIREAGYTPGIYANREWQKNVLDMTAFQDTVVWFAGFSDTPQTAYHFEYWQYSHTGRVDGIASDADVDMDIRMVPRSAAR